MRLTLFVDVVDAELLEAVVLEDLKADGGDENGTGVSDKTQRKDEVMEDEGSPVDIEDTDNVIVPDFRLHRDVDSVDDPLKESLVCRRGGKGSAATLTSS